MKKIMIPVIGVLIALGVAVTGALALMDEGPDGSDRSGKSFLEFLVTGGTSPDILTGATAPAGSDNPGGADAVSSATPGGGTAPGSSDTDWDDDDSDEDDGDDEDEEDDDEDGEEEDD